MLNVCLIINLPAPSPAKPLTSTAPAPLSSRQRGSRGAPGPGQCRPRGLQGRGLAQSGKLSDVELCTFIAHCGDVEGEEDWRQVEQVVTLVKTLLLLSSASLEIHIVNNDHSFYTDIVTAVTSWEVSTAHKLRSISFLTGWISAFCIYTVSTPTPWSTLQAWRASIPCSACAPPRGFSSTR